MFFIIHYTLCIIFTVNGGYGDWGEWGDCSINCGTGGVRYRHRLCDNPPTQYGGDPCAEDPFDREGCDKLIDCGKFHHSP